MKKVWILVAALLLTPLVAGLYGMLHDQLSYTISPEYFTRFKFIQFRLEGQLDRPFRVLAAIVGFRATWWVGIYLGVVQGFTGLMQTSPHRMLRAVSRGVLLNLLTALVTGLIGLYIGYYELAKTGVSWTLPPGLSDQRAFIAVGSMHNFGYLGGAIGAIVGVGYQVYYYWRQRYLLKRTTYTSDALSLIK